MNVAFIFPIRETCGSQKQLAHLCNSKAYESGIHVVMNIVEVYSSLCAL